MEEYEDEACEEKVCEYDGGISVDVEKEEFDPVKYEQRMEKQMRHDIERDIKSSKEEREQMEIKRRLAKKMIDEYYKGNVDDAPHYIRSMLIDREDEKIRSVSERILNIPEDDINALEAEVKKLNARQTEIFEYFCDKEKFKELRSRLMTGQYVSEYKKIEGLKSVLLDRLQMIYLGKPFGESFNSNFCEPVKHNGLDREYRF